ncbi:MAG: hypothetical protein IPP58_05820 [Holophagaceae bacterium]|uniref:Uncharacterized protein n=1 Tax=Candidatus Geothrix skivensis TaxID=2954439 RepID=A0A9D7SGX1_9BACT|nr:hypothetical protein [Candidatus Geothrix skivensis]
MKRPVFSFETELLTDAPFEHIAGRLQGMDSPAGFRCLVPLRTWQPVEWHPEEIRLCWNRQVAGSLELGFLCIRPHEKGAHLRLEGRMKGWSAFLLFGLLRWRTDRLLDRLVEEL